MSPTMNLPKMLKYKNKSIETEQFALKYIEHDVLTKNAFRENKYQCVVAYQQLAKQLGLAVWSVRVFEKLFRNQLYDKMQALVRGGLKHARELPAEPRWLALVERKVNILPALLQEEHTAARLGGAAPDAVVRALRSQALLRGSLCARAGYESVRRAHRLSATVHDLHVAWVTAQRLSMSYLALASRAGDARNVAPSLSHTQIADIVLLFTDVDTHQLITDESEGVYAEAEALSVLWQLVQRHRLEERAPPHSRVLAQRWSRAHEEYLASERQASVVVLQRRWHELKLRARRALLARYQVDDSGPPPPAPTSLLINILTRYPHVATRPPPRWRQLVEAGLVVTAPLSDTDIEGDNDGTVSARVTSPSAPATIADVSTRVAASAAPGAGARASCGAPPRAENLDIESVLQTMDPSKIKTEILMDSDTENELYDAELKIDLPITYTGTNDNGVCKENNNSEIPQIMITLVPRNENLNADFDNSKITKVFEATHDLDIKPYIGDGKDDVCVKQEPSIASRIVFADDYEFTFDHNQDSGDEEITGSSIDVKLLMYSCINLTRIDDTEAWRRHSYDDKSIDVKHLTSRDETSDDSMSHDKMSHDKMSHDKMSHDKMSHDETSGDSMSHDNHVMSVVIKPIDVHDITLNDVKSNDVQRNDVKSNDVMSTDMKSNDVKSNDVKSNDVKSNDVKSNDVKSNDVKSTNVKMNDVKSTDVKSNDLKANAVTPDDVTFDVTVKIEPIDNPIRGRKRSRTEFEKEVESSAPGNGDEAKNEGAVKYLDEAKSDKRVRPLPWFNNVARRRVRVSKALRSLEWHGDETRQGEEEEKPLQVIEPPPIEPPPIEPPPIEPPPIEPPPIKPTPVTANTSDLPTEDELQLLLVQLSNIATAQQMLSARRVCCAARRAADIADARRRLGLAPLAPLSAPAACEACARHAAARARLATELRALHADVCRMMQEYSAYSQKKNKDKYSAECQKTSSKLHSTCKRNFKKDGESHILTNSFRLNKVDRTSNITPTSDHQDKQIHNKIINKPLLDLKGDSKNTTERDIIKDLDRKIREIAQQLTERKETEKKVALKAEVSRTLPDIEKNNHWINLPTLYKKIVAPVDVSVAPVQAIQSQYVYGSEDNTTTPTLPTRVRPMLDNSVHVNNPHMEKDICRSKDAVLPKPLPKPFILTEPAPPPPPLPYPVVADNTLLAETKTQNYNQQITQKSVTQNIEIVSKDKSPFTNMIEKLKKINEVLKTDACQCKTDLSEEKLPIDQKDIAANVMNTVDKLISPLLANDEENPLPISAEPNVLISPNKSIKVLSSITLKQSSSPCETSQQMKEHVAKVEPVNNLDEARAKSVWVDFNRSDHTYSSLSLPQNDLKELPAIVKNETKQTVPKVNLQSFKRVDTIGPVCKTIYDKNTKPDDMKVLNETNTAASKTKSNLNVSDYPTIQQTGYDEWIRQKNLINHFFQIPGAKFRNLYEKSEYNKQDTTIYNINTTNQNLEENRDKLRTKDRQELKLYIPIQRGTTALSKTSESNGLVSNEIPLHSAMETKYVPLSKTKLNIEDKTSLNGEPKQHGTSATLQKMDIIKQSMSLSKILDETTASSEIELPAVLAQTDALMPLMKQETNNKSEINESFYKIEDSTSTDSNKLLHIDIPEPGDALRDYSDYEDEIPLPKTTPKDKPVSVPPKTLQQLFKLSPKVLDNATFSNKDIPTLIVGQYPKDRLISPKTLRRTQSPVYIEIPGDLDEKHKIFSPKLQNNVNPLKISRRRDSLISLGADQINYKYFPVSKQLLRTHTDPRILEYPLEIEIVGEYPSRKKSVSTPKNVPGDNEFKKEKYGIENEDQSKMSEQIKEVIKADPRTQTAVSMPHLDVYEDCHTLQNDSPGVANAQDNSPTSQKVASQEEVKSLSENQASPTSSLAAVNITATDETKSLYQNVASLPDTEPKGLIDTVSTQPLSPKKRVPLAKSLGSPKLPARLVQRRISDGIRKCPMFMVPSSSPGRNNIINVPEVEEVKFIAPEHLEQKKDCLLGLEDLVALDPVRLIPYTALDKLKVDTPLQARPLKRRYSQLTVSGINQKKLQEIPVIPDKIVAEAQESKLKIKICTSDVSKSVETPLSFKRPFSQSLSFDDKDMPTMVLKDKLQARWFKDYIPKPTKRRYRRKYVPTAPSPDLTSHLSPTPTEESREILTKQNAIEITAVNPPEMSSFRSSGKQDQTKKSPVRKRAMSIVRNFQRPCRRFSTAVDKNVSKKTHLKGTPKMNLLKTVQITNEVIKRRTLQTSAANVLKESKSNDHINHWPGRNSSKVNDSTTSPSSPLSSEQLIPESTTAKEDHSLEAFMKDPVHYKAVDFKNVCFNKRRMSLCQQERSRKNTRFDYICTRLHGDDQKEKAIAAVFKEHFPRKGPKPSPKRYSNANQNIILDDIPEPKFAPPVELDEASAESARLDQALTLEQPDQLNTVRLEEQNNKNNATEAVVTPSDVSIFHFLVTPNEPLDQAVVSRNGNEIVIRHDEAAPSNAQSESVIKITRVTITPKQEATGYKKPDVSHILRLVENQFIQKLAGKTDEAQNGLKQDSLSTSGTGTHSHNVLVGSVDTDTFSGVIEILNLVRDPDSNTLRVDTTDHGYKDLKIIVDEPHTSNKQVIPKTPTEDLLEPTDEPIMSISDIPFPEAVPSLVDIPLPEQPCPEHEEQSSRTVDYEITQDSAEDADAEDSSTSSSSYDN